MLDLHTHSTFSDGSLTPEELVDRAVGQGVTALALTDHDSTAGHARFLAACKRRGLRGVPGVEISADFSPGTAHMLGYWVQAGSEPLEDALLRIRDGRNVRNREILGKLQALGVDLRWEDVASLAEEGVVGRPHFAMAMLARGVVKDTKEAFDRFLAKGKSAYVDRFRLTPQDSLARIRAAGGVPVLAHPFSLQLKAADLDTFVRGLKDQGLEGIEVYYPEHTPRRTRQYRRLAERYGLALSGGTDFHGEMTPHTEIGRGFGSLDVADALLDELERRRP